MRLRIAAALLACLLPGLANAWIEIGTKYIGGVTFFQLGDICDSARFPLTPGSCSGTASNPDWRAEVQQAIGRWHSATGNFQFFTDPGQGASTPGECSSQDVNSLFFLDDICEFADFGETTLAVALTSFFFDGVAVHSDVIFNTAFLWRAYDDASSNHGAAIDFTRVAVHELGHVAGLDHPFHELAIMSPFFQDTVISPLPDDIAGMNAIYGASLAFAIPDQNSNSAQELVHVWRLATGKTRATIQDSDTGSVLKNMTFFGTEHQAVDATLIPDEDGSGAPELAILAIRESDLRPVVQMRNISGASNPRTILFSAGLLPLRMRNIGDADGNGISELAVLAVRESDLRAVVEIRNAIGAAQSRTIQLESLASPIDMDVLVDPLAVDPPRLAILMFKWPDDVNAGRSFLESRNAFGAQNRTKVQLQADATPLSLTVFDEAGPKAAILSTRNANGRTLVEYKNIFGSDGLPFQLWDSANAAIAIAAAGDADDDGHADIVVLSRRLSDGRVMAEVRNTDDSNQRQSGFASSFEAIGSVFALDDTDGDTFPELAALLSREQDARAAVYWRNVAGPGTVGATQIWVSPTP